MLVLQRSPEEVVEIQDAAGNVLIEVLVTEIRDLNRVRLGFTAGREFLIYRKEVAETIRREAAEAAGSGGSPGMGGAL